MGLVGIDTSETEAVAIGESPSLQVPKLSVLVAVDGDGVGLKELLLLYREALDARGESYDFTLLHEAGEAGSQEAIEVLKASWPEFGILGLRPWNGEDAAIKIGIGRARGEIIVTLPSWPEIDPGSIGALIEAADGTDMAIGRRPAQDASGVQKLRTGATHGLLRLLFQHKFNDVFCRSRAGRKDVFAAVTELGVRQHFLPVIAVSEGYRVTEVDVDVPSQEQLKGIYRFKAQAHIGAVVDLLTLFVGLKFLKRPLRFFGAIGLPLMILGFFITTLLVIDRFAFGTSLADRPALVFSVMMVVLGIQIVALGLVGEIIIFSSSRRMRTYEIDEIIRGRPTAAERSAADAVQEAESPPEGDGRQS